VNALPSAVVAPVSEVAIDGLPRREVRWQHPPEPARKTYRMASTTARRWVLRAAPTGNRRRSRRQVLPTARRSAAWGRLGW
jgi:hypothetical protein